MPRKIRIALAGAGAIAGAYADALPFASGVDTVAWCDIDLGAAFERARAVNANPYSSFDRMLRDERPDAVVIATPPNTHRRLAEAALEAGCAVLCEKPFAPTVEDANGMIAASRACGRPVAMAAKFRFVGDVANARRSIAEGAIGNPLALEICFTSNVPMRGRWNANAAISGGGVIADNGPHAFDLVRAFGGPIDAVRAIEHARYQGLEVEDTAAVAVRCENGLFATLDLSWSLNKQLPHFLRVYGTAGTIDVGWKASHLTAGSERTLIGNGYDKRSAFTGILEEFAGVVRGDAEPSVGAKEALATVEATEAAYASLAEARWLPAAGELVA